MAILASAARRPAGRHAAGRDGLVPFTAPRRAIRRHRRPRPTIRQFLSALATIVSVHIIPTERILPPRVEGQPETAGATTPERNGEEMTSMMDDRWNPPPADPMADTMTIPAGGFAAAVMAAIPVTGGYPTGGPDDDQADTAEAEEPALLRPYVLREVTK